MSTTDDLSAPPRWRILLLGATGLLGRAVAAALQDGFEVMMPPRAQLDLLRAQEVAAFLRQHRPAVVINCAGWSDVDGAQDHPEAAGALNHGAVAALVQACDAAAASLIHFSTDFVFDGRKTAAYTEADLPAPLSVYGQSKLAGEQAVLASAGAHLVLRVSWLYGPGGRNFFSQVRGWLQQDRELRVVADQVSVPNHVQPLAAALREVLARAASERGDFLGRHRGLYHLSASGQASRYEFAREAARALGDRAVARLLPVAAASFPMKAERPAFSALSSRRFERAFGIALADWREAVRAAAPAGA
ncbi:dTDP-4-dehydrorhamnose reductase [Variovorax terrae]|uniref:dTDP-4-dehydrorhamnose reductase n=1 Tax=Variovorax terrae TaxID=2923278 RepID=A0A9X1VS88_9BURK|nr:dTDP-4-dehydrorhamnose reductase [Variovorax terrae]MCJ0762851.1 dTDP-4-dehydrorhamnose reductase [Variovorax terrae]